MSDTARRIVQALRSAGIGGSEAALRMGTSAVAQPVGGLAGLMTLGLGGTAEDANKISGDTQSALTYDPRTQEGQRVSHDYVDVPFEQLRNLMHKVPEKLQDWGLPSGAAATIATGMELAPNLLGEGKKGRGVAGIPWDQMGLQQAREAAQSGAHLQRGSSGRYAGGPAKVTSPQKLASMRGGIDKAVESGAFGADWYERARKAISDVSTSPEQADKLSQMLALYSPQATPDVNMGHALKQINDYALKGDKSDVKPFYKPQAEKGRAIMRGDHLGDEDTGWLGPKVGVYEQHINPLKEDEAKVRGVNDIWMGRAYGYGGKEFAAGFKDAQHSFMTGENLLAADRAKAKGLLPEGTDPNVGNVQAAAWVGKRFGELTKQKGNARVIKALMKEGNLEGALAFDKKLREQAAQSYDSVLPKYTANETYEQVPGRATGHMAGIQDEPFETRDQFSRAVDWSKPGEHDPLYKALGMYQLPTTKGLGQFTETVKKPIIEPAIRDPQTGRVYKGGPTHGEIAWKMPSDVLDRMPDFEPMSDSVGDTTNLRSGHWAGFLKHPEEEFISRRQASKVADDWLHPEERNVHGLLTSEDLSGGGVPKVDVTSTDYNPNRTAHPLVSYGKGAKDFDPASSSLLEQTNAFRSAMDAQAAGAYGGVAQGAGNTGDAARVKFSQPLTQERTKALYDAVQKAGLDLVDNGGGEFKVTKFMGPEGDRIDPKDFAARFRTLEPYFSKAEVQHGGHVGGYQELPWGPEKSGQVTDWLLGKVDPHVAAKLHTPEVSYALARKNLNETDFATNNLNVGLPREDLQKLRGMIAERGLNGVRELVKQAGGGVAGAAKLGLPAVALTYLGMGDENEAPAP